MKFTYSSFLGIVLSCILALFASLSSINGFVKEGFWLVSLSSITLLISGKLLMKNYTNFLMIFLAFSLLYGLSGPFNVLYGEGLPQIFSQPYQTNFFLLHYSLAIIGIAIGMLASYALPYRNYKDKATLIHKNPLLLISLAIIFAVLSTFFELINFFRVGGLSIVALEKAVYQSELANLTLTLPGEQVSLLSFALLSISLGILKFKGTSFKSVRGHIIAFFIAIMPVLFIITVLGRRGILLYWVLIIIVGITYFRPIGRLSAKIIIIVLVTYIVMGFLYANRWAISYAVGTGNWEVFYLQASKRERLISALNPGLIEFGAAFGNFSEYVNWGNSDLRMGETYFIGLLEAIPEFIYPGKKPKSITYEFRDMHFPLEAERGTIAGTGFSSILEAYINFGTIGVFGVYFLIGIFLILWERLRTTSKSLSFIIFYLLVLPLSVSFHRSCLGFPIFWPVVLLILFWMVYSVLSLKPKFRTQNL